MSIERYYVPGIVIERSTETMNSFNEPVKTWSTHLTISGRIRPLSGREAVSSEREGVISTHRLYCDILDITTKDRVVYGSQTYDISFCANPMNFDRFMQIDLVLVK